MTTDHPEDRSPPDLPPPEAWIETRAGGLFFVNALLIAPAALALLPWLLGALARAAGVVRGASPVLDTIPTMAWYFIPRLGWLALPAAWLAWKALAVVDRAGPRRWLFLFLGVHLATVGLTVARWTGLLG